jgi:hypothetical protein
MHHAGLQVWSDEQAGVLVDAHARELTADLETASPSHALDLTSLETHSVA